MNYTSIEQSNELVELGLDPNTADMTWGEELDNITKKLEWKISAELNVAIKDNLFSYRKGYVIPCWSVGALLEVMPKAIRKYDERERCYKTYHPNLYQAYYHCCGYAFGPSLNQENHDMLCTFGDDTWIDVIYKQVVWLLENGYIEKGE